jgi:hypothetical protein
LVDRVTRCVRGPLTQLCPGRAVIGVTPLSVRLT